jgi:3-oxoacyl-[acyl-carrier-protein] synthase-3
MNHAVVIAGTGSVLPEEIIPNSAFLDREFMDENGQPFPYSNEVVIEKFQQITEIVERRYARADQNSSDLGTEAAQKALQQAGWNPEDLDLIIVGQNYGDIDLGTRRIDQLPSIASRIKHNLGVANPRTVAFDVLAGCPGWIQGVLVANAYLQAGMAKKALVVGTETLSRIIDVHDRDSMIFADGAGATCLEVRENAQGAGILGFASATHTKDEAYYLQSQPSVNPLGDRNERFLRMKGRKIYEFALRHVPDAMKAALDHAGVDLKDVKKIFMHQANAKLDHGVGERLYKLYGMVADLDQVMPMSIQHMGNSSVATVPTLLDLVLREKYQGHEVNPGDIVLFGSVGAGMNISAFVYRF